MVQVQHGETICGEDQINQYLGAMANNDLLLFLGKKKTTKAALGVGAEGLMLCRRSLGGERDTDVGSRIVAHSILGDEELVFETGVQKRADNYLLVERPTEIHRVRVHKRDNGRVITPSEHRAFLTIDACKAGVVLAFSTDISTTGIGFQFRHSEGSRVPLDIPVNCRILLSDNSEIGCQMVITWVDAAGDGAYQAGGRFVGITNHSHQLIEEFMALLTKEAA